jgi:nucleotide-binding universal stress UspA family protein
MIESILVPLDGSIFAEHALPAAIDLAKRNGATLHLVRVHQPPILPSPDAPVIVDTAWIEAIRAEEVAYIDRIAEQEIAPTGLQFAKRLVDGFPADALRDHARAEAIDLIVMTTHGRGGFSRFWLGSVADALVRQSRTPVLLIRPHAEEPADEVPPALRHILVPTDGSQLSYGVLGKALALGGPGAARFTLLRVLAPHPAAPFPRASWDVDRDVPRAERAAALAALEEVAGRLRVQGVDAACAVVVHPVPAQAIVDFSVTHAVDAITLATSGRSGWTRVALGSVADKVMRATTLPVLLYRPDPSRTGGLAVVAGSGESAVIHGEG